MILPGIQVLRGVAALLVVVYHGAILAEKPKYFNQEIFGGIFHAGYRGVDLFFVISGFIMMHTLVQNHNMKAQSFLVNRFLRIFIPYLPAFLGLTLVYLIIPSVAQGGIELNVSYYIYNLLLLPRIDLTTYVPVVAWTLTHELIFQY
jgi:exopolysaccharide production protein ExoZ